MHLVAGVHGAGVGAVVEAVVVAGEVLHLAVYLASSLHHDGRQRVFLQCVGRRGVVVGDAGGAGAVDGGVA